RVATVKHSPRGFELDQAEKDSWRHIRAGSDTVVISSPQKLALVRPQDHDAPLTEILDLIGEDFDLVLVEGFKKAGAPKIEVHGEGSETGLVCTPEELIAVVTDAPLDADVTQFSPEDISSIASLIEQTVMGGCPPTNNQK
ncbi:MAG: molybdopterin-guanine dinucleotide biosynthesis protein B, partial [Dehalococcoidia bacterium]